MFYALKNDCYFRRYGELGYIVRPIIFQEEVVDDIGSYFVEKLSYEFCDIKDIVKGLLEEFDGVNQDEITRDAIEFYDNLANDGFIDAVENIDEDKIQVKNDKVRIISKEPANYKYGSASKLLLSYAKKILLFVDFILKY